MIAADSPEACVLGDLELIRPLSRAGARCVVVAPRGAAARYSRRVADVIDYAHPLRRGPELLDRLLRYADSRDAAPVLFYQEDEDLLFVSRHREDLRGAFRFVIAEPRLVEEVVDKSRFQALAARLDLPVPPGVVLPAGGTEPPSDLPDFPLVVKPVLHDRRWNRGLAFAKAARVAGPDELRALLRRMDDIDTDLLVQHYVTGGEERIESYHCYVDADGEVVAEFTGRKIRTIPPEHGFTTALTTTDAPDVVDVGRRVVNRLGLTGVAKLDFKREASGRLWLLEVNPRFNLWHHVGAAAGVNLPGLVWADLAGAPPPATAAGGARPGVTWSRPWSDLKVAREVGVGMRGWLSWTLRSDTFCVAEWNDPAPFLRGEVVPRVAAAVRRRNPK